MLALLKNMNKYVIMDKNRFYNKNEKVQTMKNPITVCFCVFMSISTIALSTFGAGCGTKKLTITSPTGEVVPYIEQAKQYLLQSRGDDVSQYCGSHGSIKNPQTPIVVEWTCEAKDAIRYKVEYATNADYTNALYQTVRGETRAELYNLFKGMEYHLRVTAYSKNNKVVSVGESTFNTTDLGPRVMNIDGLHNVRDVGGYTTVSGKRTVQGLLYRGGTLMSLDGYESELTADGADYMRKVLGIKTDADLRTQTETGYTESPIPAAELRYFGLGGYTDMLNASVKPLFQMLADKNSYPIYLHCTGGADRTGTATFLINALLGVDEKMLIQDYEFTSFSLYGMRNTQKGEYASMFQDFLSKLKAFEGESLQQKTENFLLSIGVTIEEIESIKAIMYGEK